MAGDVRAASAQPSESDAGLLTAVELLLPLPLFERLLLLLLTVDVAVVEAIATAGCKRDEV